MRHHLNTARRDRRVRQLEQAATVRRPRPTARDRYAAATLTEGLRPLG
jgi:hypothetical protein